VTGTFDWDRLRDALGDLLELAPGERAPALQLLAREEPDFAAELGRLLEAAEDDGGFLSEPAVDRVAALRPRAAVPERIGPWRLEAEIGSGGMGAVWRGRRDDGAFDQVVAVKLVRPDLAREIGHRRLEVERRILASLEHPAIARLIDGGTTASGLAYLVLEHVDGEPIDAWCDRRRLPLRGRLELFSAVCAAVDFAHRKLVLHRDIKSSNVMVDGAGRPKLLDFGIAKLLDPLAGDREQTMTGGARPMTPAWASPEQLRGEPLTLAADVYSLGLLLCALTAGARPALAEAGSAEQLARGIEARGAPKLEELARGGAAPGVDPRRLGGDLARVAAHALEPDPALRYRSAAELAADVEAFLAGRPIAAHPPSLVYRARKFARRHAAAVAIAGASVVALLASTAVSVTQARRARVEKARAEARLSDLRELSGTFLFESERRLRDLAGATALRRDVAATALRYLDLLAAEAGDDAALLADLAHGYVQLGQVQGSPFLPNLGETAAAGASAERALELARRLERLAPGPALAGRTLAEAHQLRGDLRLGAAANAAAGADFAAAVAAARAALEAAPADPQARRLLTSSLSRQAMVAAASGRLEAAIEAHRAALDATRAFARDDPAGFERNELVSRLLLGESLFNAGRIAEALTELEPALADAAARSAREPDNVLAERDFAAASDRAIQAFLAAGRGAQALDIAARALVRVERVAALDPDNDLGRFDVASSLTLLAQAARVAGDPARAESDYRRALEISRALVARDPHNVAYRRAVVASVSGLGEVAESRARRDDAIAAYDASREELLSMLEAMPEDVDARRALAIVERRLGSLLERREPVRALGHLRRSLAAAELAAGAGPGDLPTRTELAESRFRLGAALLAAAPGTAGQASSEACRLLAEAERAARELPPPNAGPTRGYAPLDEIHAASRRCADPRAR
jgi:tetratricopeptide (TPR) repeat protein